MLPIGADDSATAVEPSSSFGQSGIIPSLDIVKQPGLYQYQYRVSLQGEEMFGDLGFASIGEALESASDVSGDIRGFKVSYGALTIGTYPMLALRTDAEVIARRAVVTAAALADD